ncbi:hypothetical protein HK100_005080 [Physocladia obscura]|uniref:Uncharacterized protein n=1 Tax=Physocladia obscura TaxID=109957 RepID=A0AAD5T708_9FUNG|nr:hypothetical protein HK100_005080 [Physocladia obscura]
MTEDNNHLAVPLPTAAGGKGREKDKKDKKEAPRSVGGGSTRSKASWFSFKSSRSRNTPVVEDNSLSITERFFFKTAPSKQQVLMCILVRIRLPPACDNVAPARIVDLLRIAQAKHYRLSAWIDHESLGALPFADKAANLPTSYRFIERDGDNWMDVYSDEININFDTDDSSKPLWRSSIIVPKEWMPEPGSDCYNNQTPIVPDHQKKLDYPIKYSRANSDQLGFNQPAPDPSGRYFDLMSTFHHCLGDGLSMLAFARTFLECADAAHINAKDLDLANINVSQDPPPLLDNLFNPSVFEILPTAVNMGVKTFGKKKSRLGHTGTSTMNLDGPSLKLPLSPEPSPSPADTPEPERRITPSPSPQPEILVGPVLGSLPGRGYTNVRFLHFSSDFTTVLRKKSKSEKTTIAAVLVVAALTACRSLFVHGAKRDGKDVKKAVPNSQGWVITNSIRHILPQSKLLQGGDRETDEGLKVFGGYAGSVSNNNLKLADDSLIWDRCRSVKRGITHSFRDSIQRMKVANYAYRRPKLWEMAEKRVDLAKLSRSFSVEIANLGAWEYPCAPPDAPETDQRCRLDYFGGGLNSSFEGSRGLFSLGIITFGGNMSVFVCYDVKSVTVDEAEVFFKAFSECLKRMSTSKANVSVGEIYWTDLQMQNDTSSEDAREALQQQLQEARRCAIVLKTASNETRIPIPAQNSHVQFPTRTSIFSQKSAYDRALAIEAETAARRATVLESQLKMLQYRDERKNNRSMNDSSSNSDNSNNNSEKPPPFPKTKKEILAQHYADFEGLISKSLSTIESGESQPTLTRMDNSKVTILVSAPNGDRKESYVEKKSKLPPLPKHVHQTQTQQNGSKSHARSNTAPLPASTANINPISAYNHQQPTDASIIQLNEQVLALLSNRHESESIAAHSKAVEKNLRAQIALLETQLTAAAEKEMSLSQSLLFDEKDSQIARLNEEISFLKAHAAVSAATMAAAERPGIEGIEEDGDLGIMLVDMQCQLRASQDQNAEKDEKIANLAGEVKELKRRMEKEADVTVGQCLLLDKKDGLIGQLREEIEYFKIQMATVTSKTEGVEEVGGDFGVRLLDMQCQLQANQEESLKKDAMIRSLLGKTDKLKSNVCALKSQFDTVSAELVAANESSVLAAIERENTEKKFGVLLDFKDDQISKLNKKLICDVEAKTEANDHGSKKLTDQKLSLLMDEKYNEIKFLQNELNNLIAEIENLKNNANDDQLRIQELENQNHAQNVRMMELHQEIQEANTQLKKFQTQVTNMAVKHEKEKLNAKLDKDILEQMLTQTESKLADVQNEFENSLLALQEKDFPLQELRTANMKIKSEYENNCILETIKPEENSQLTKMRQELTALSQEFGKLQQLNNDSEKLTEMYQKITETEILNKTLNKKIKKLELELAEANQELQIFQQQFDAASKELEKSISANSYTNAEKKKIDQKLQETLLRLKQVERNHEGSVLLLKEKDQFLAKANEQLSSLQQQLKLVQQHGLPFINSSISKEMVPQKFADDQLQEIIKNQAASLQTKDLIILELEHKIHHVNRKDSQFNHFDEVKTFVESADQNRGEIRGDKSKNF